MYKTFDLISSKPLEPGSTTPRSIEADRSSANGQSKLNRRSIEANRSSIEANRNSIEANRSSIEVDRISIEVDRISIEVDRIMIESNRIYIFFRFDCSSIDRINRIQSFD